MRNIKITEADYRKGKRAIERLESIRPEIEEIHQKIWKVKNKLNKGNKNGK